MTKWRRPYRDPYWLLSVIFPVGGCVYLAALVATAIADWPDTSTYTLVMCLAIAVAIPLTWRLYGTSLLISDEGVRLRWQLFTRTVALVGHPRVPDPGTADHARAA